MKTEIHTILAIESSFDETAASVVVDGTRCLANIVSSQIPLHAKYGGVIPEIAARAHIEQIIPVIEQAMFKAFGEGSAQELIRTHIDAIAVTAGPGLIGSLLVGVGTARALALTFNKPLIPVHHIMGHVYSNFLIGGQKIEVKSMKDDDLFPFITLVASGGHTELILSHSHTNHELISQTRDDAAGEAFDKAAHILGLAYPGGPSISQAALQGDEKAYTLPRGMAKDTGLDFSFSGVKTALLQLVASLKNNGADLTAITPDLAASFQSSIVDSLVQKTIAAAKAHQVHTIYLAGGVAANTSLRQALEAASTKIGAMFQAPLQEYCTDNAAMVAAAGYTATLTRDTFPWYDVVVERQPKLAL